MTKETSMPTGDFLLSFYSSRSNSPVSSPALQQIFCCGLCLLFVPIPKELNISRWNTLLSSLMDLFSLCLLVQSHSEVSALYTQK